MKDLKTFRVERGMSLEQLAAKAELTKATLINIERKYTRPQADVRKRIEIVLGEKIDWLTTCGLLPVRSVSWEQAESEYRKSLLNVHGLNEDQQELYMEMSYEYLKSLIILRGLEKQVKAKRIIQTNDNDVIKRKRTK
jgi:transcriptional regulator with XRE-family HTH domain